MPPASCYYHGKNYGHSHLSTHPVKIQLILVVLVAVTDNETMLALLPHRLCFHEQETRTAHVAGDLSERHMHLYRFWPETFWSSEPRRLLLLHTHFGVLRSHFAHEWIHRINGTRA